MNTTHTTTTKAEAREAMQQRGIVGAEHYMRYAAPEAILNACRWWDDQKGLRLGLLVNAIRDGGMDTYETPQRDAMLDKQAAYGHSVADYVRDHYPDLCRQDPKVIEWERKLYGEEAGERLAHSTSPHYAAVAAVIRLHYTHGKLTVTEHGPIIRAAVRKSNLEAIADYELIASKRRR